MLNASQADVRRVDVALEAQGAQDPAWWDVVARFRAAAAQMEDVFQRLVAARDYAAARPALAARYQQLLARASSVRATVQAIRAQLESAIAWLRSVGAAVGLDGLGVVPIIGIAAIAAAIVLVTRWTTETIVFLKSIEEQKRLEAAGVAPERAAAIVRESVEASRSPLIDLGAKWLPLAILAAGGWFAWRQWGRRG